jgi:hypothetical protein
MKETIHHRDVFNSEMCTSNLDSPQNNMDVNSPLSPSSVLSYEDERIRRKLDPWMAGVMVVQSTIGISLFTLHEPLSKVGLLPGFIITAFTCYMTMYGATRLDWVSAQYEAKQTRSSRIKNAYELFSLIPGKYADIIKWLAVMSNTVMMGASTITNTLLLCILISSSRSSIILPESIKVRIGVDNIHFDMLHVIPGGRTREDR